MLSEGVAPRPRPAQDWDNNTQRPRSNPHELLHIFLRHESKWNRSVAVLSCCVAVCYVLVCSLFPWPPNPCCGDRKAAFVVLVFVSLDAIHGVFQVHAWRKACSSENREIIGVIVAIMRLLYFGCLVNAVTCGVGFWGFAVTVKKWDIERGYHPFIAMFCIVAIWGLSTATYWTYKMLRFVALCPEPLPDAEVFLLCRCACLPSKARKAILPGLFAVAAILYALALVRYRKRYCNANLHLFLALAVAIFAVFSTLLALLYTVPRQKQAWIMGLLAINSLLAFTWSITGTAWIDYSNCAQQAPRLYNTAESCKIVLFVSCTVFPFFAVCCKIERCFPSRRDALTVHSDTYSERRGLFAFNKRRGALLSENGTDGSAEAVPSPMWAPRSLPALVSDSSKIDEESA